MRVLKKLQRGYAFAVFTLRDFFRPSLDRFYDWKATFVLVLSLVLLVMSALYTASAISGRLLGVLSDGKRFDSFIFVLSVTFYFINSQAQRLLLPRFEREYLALQSNPKRKRLTTIAVVSGLVLIVAISGLARFAAPGR